MGGSSWLMQAQSSARAGARLRCAAMSNLPIFVQSVPVHELAAGDEAQWEALLSVDPDATIYLGPAFLRAAAAHPAPGEEPLRLLVARDPAGVVLGLLPCAARRASRLGLPLREVSIGDPGYLMQRRGPLLRPGPQRAQVLGALVQQLSQEPFSRLHAHALLPHTAAELCAALRRAGCPCGLRPDLRSPYLPLTGGWDDYLKSRSPAVRQGLRRLQRRLLRDYRAELRLLRDPAEVEAAWPLVEQVARASWSHAQGTSILTPTGPERAYRPLLLAEAARGRLWLSLLLLDGAPVAVQIDLLLNGVLYLQKPFYAESAAALSPGRYLLAEVLQRAFAAAPALREYDFGGHDEPYKLQLAGEGCLREHHLLRAYRRGPLGLGEHLLRHHVLPALRRR